MTSLVELLKKLLRDVALFVRCTGGIRLRNYQEAIARAVVHSVLHQQGLSFVVILPRQSGKNELQAQLQAYLLTLLSTERCEMVQVSPTWRHQTENAMHRLETVLSGNWLVKDRWEKHFGHVYQVGGARLVFLSGSPTTSIVGATANLLLSVDEAQDILSDKYDKEIAPDGCQHECHPCVWGTAWTANTLLAREEKAAGIQQEADGIQRVWRLTCDLVAAEVPAYGKFVAEQVDRLGRHHPMVRTQYYSEDIDADGGLFPPERMALIYGIHPPRIAPSPGEIYVMSLDIAGEDERVRMVMLLRTLLVTPLGHNCQVNTATSLIPGCFYPPMRLFIASCGWGPTYRPVRENPLACHDLGSALSGVRCHGYWCRVDGFSDPIAGPKGDPFCLQQPHQIRPRLVFPLPDRFGQTQGLQPWAVSNCA